MTADSLIEDIRARGGAAAPRVRRADGARRDDKPNRAAIVRLAAVLRAE